MRNLILLTKITGLLGYYIRCLLIPIEKIDISNKKVIQMQKMLIQLNQKGKLLRFYFSLHKNYCINVPLTTLIKILTDLINIVYHSIFSLQTILNHRKIISIINFCLSEFFK